MTDLKINETEREPKISNVHLKTDYVISSLKLIC